MGTHFQFDAYQAYADLRRRYVDFLVDIVGIRGGALPPLLDAFWNTDGLDSCLFAPMLVQGAFPYEEGAYLDDLAKPQGGARATLQTSTVSLLKSAGVTYKLFDHQVRAIRQAAEGRTVVVAAGTGSGKTEAFLIPIIDRLLRDHQQGLDDLSEPGVRALVVYPLNALVNNQVERLHALLKGQSQITFAYYTSRLKETRREAEAYLNARRRSIPEPCQIIDRQSLRGLDARAPRRGPPHILVTNFSMLEYMLIRPLDRTVFLAAHTHFKGKPRLKVIVLDEAHVYAGAQAAEMHMLLRRAAERFGTTLEDVQGYATSATLAQAGGPDSGKALSEYACRMFSKEKGHVAVIEGHRRLPPANVPTRAAPALAVPSASVMVPDEIRTVEFASDGRSSRLLADQRVAADAAQACVDLGLATRADVDSVAPADKDVPALMLYRLCASHPGLLKARKALFQSQTIPTLDETGDLLFGPGPVTDARRRATDSILRLASLAREKPDELPLIPVRMHAFVRAPLGVWVDPRPPATRLHTEWPWGALHLLPGDDEEVPRLQLLVCLACGAPYLEAARTADGFAPPSGDDKDIVALTESPSGDTTLPGNWGSQRVYVVQATESDRHRNRIVASCAACRTPDARLRTLRLSPRLAFGAMLDAMFPHLGEIPAPEHTLPGGGRRLITFSDSRREAARVAAQVERTHDIGLNRQILWQRVRQTGRCRVHEVIRDLSQEPVLMQRASAAGLTDDDALEDLATLSAFEEFSRPPAGARERGQVTLEMLGLVEVSYPDLPARPSGLGSMSDQEWSDFLRTVLDLLRSAGCTASPVFRSDQARAQDLDELLPFQGKAFVRTAPEPGEEEDNDDDTLTPRRDRPIALIPRAVGSRSRILSYATRVAGAVGLPVEVLLSAVWDELKRKADARCRWLRAGPRGEGLQVLLTELELVAHDNPPLLSPQTGALYFRHVRGVLPESGGTGLARPPASDEISAWRKRHSVRRVTEDEALGLWSVEHTAQLEVDALEEQEDEFRAGRRNLLASSTTMEMGVDIGGLTLVCLTNVPPGPANYWQRAGRAGRRADGTSMTMTLALATSHDQLVFSDPRDFLFAPVTPPRVRLDAEPLLVRHVNGFLLARFFEDSVATGAQGNPMTAFGSVGAFVEDPSGSAVLTDARARLALSPADPLCVGFSRWLAMLPEKGELAARVANLCKGTILATDSLPQLAARASEQLEDAVEKVRRDLETVDAQRKQEEAKGEGARDEQYLRALAYQRAAIVDETLISYLASTGFLPRFGFPLDVVRLNTRWKKMKGQDSGPNRSPEYVPDMRMERALDLALAEYAPGSEVIAGKRIFTSAGLERNWFADEEAVERHFFFECQRCHHLEDGKVEHSSCPVCGHPTIPEHQFIENRRDEAAQNKRRKRRGDDEDYVDPSLIPPSVIRQYLRPSGFAVKLGRRPRRVTGEIERVGPLASRLVLSQPEARRELVPGAFAVAYCPESRVFTRAEGYPDFRSGRGYGFAICRACGLAVPEDAWGGAVPAAFQGHNALRGEKRCSSSGVPWRNRVLGTSTPIDALRVELGGELVPRLTDPVEVDSFYGTLAAVLQLVAARCLQVDLRALSSAVATRKVPEGFVFDAVVYESSTSGLLRFLAEKPAVLVEELLRLLRKGRLADFVRFDTQFLGTRLRPDLVRAHFTSDRVESLLKLRDLPDVQELRGRGPMLAAMELLDDAAQSITLLTDRVAPEAFEQHALLPHVRARAVDPRMQAVPVRMLVAECPGPEAPKVDDALAAAQLKRLVEDGVRVRRVSADDASSISSSRWHVVARKGDTYTAIGGIDAPQASADVAQRFGPRWLDRQLPVEAVPEEAKRAFEHVDALWARAVDVKAADMEPRRLEKTKVLVVKQGSRAPNDTVPRRLFDSALSDLGGLAGCGSVTRLVYADRYVIRGSMPMYFLRDILGALSYAPGAEVIVRSFAPEEDGRPALTAQQLLERSRPTNLNPASSDAMKRWLTKALDPKARVEFEIRDSLPHSRKLLVEFAPGGKTKTLKLCLDQGLDWVRTESIRGSWAAGPFVANETQVVVCIDQPLAAEAAW